MCGSCGIRPAAINYKDKSGKRHYRLRCDACDRTKRKLAPKPTTWQKAGYKKKMVCEICEFKAKYAEQMIVVYVDGNLKNGNWNNLKTVCSNCHISIMKTGTRWTTDTGLKPDF